MKRRSFLAGMAAFLTIKKLTASQEGCGSWSEIRLGFVCSQPGTVYDLTAQFLGLQDSPRYGPDFVESIYGTNLSDLPGWNYFVNGFLPPMPAQYYVASAGDRIEWRFGRHPFA